MKQREKKKHNQPTPEEFIRAWQAGSSAEEIARVLRMDKRTVHVRSYFYRKHGIELKKLKRGAQPLDVPTLAKLAKSLLPKPKAPR